MQIIEYDFINNTHAQNPRILLHKELKINPSQGCICILSKTDFELFRAEKTELTFLDCGIKNPKLELYRALFLHTRQKGKARYIRLPLISVSRLKVSLSGLMRRYDRSCPFCLIVVNDQVFKEYIQSLEHKRQSTELTFSGKTNLKSLLIHKYKNDSKIKSLDREYLGVSVDTQYVRALICQSSQTKSSVLIQGETGVGKDVVARLINKHAHFYGEGIFQINCASLPETLFESELFGYEKGAFTGASTTKKGLFAEANHCTLFLDEIGELSPTNQAKLLVVLETGEIRPVGGNKKH
ncbi:MAG: sigma-54 factor interaction domain-containing protein [Bacteroidales bacterium]|nr:sigma-54 factor interaction domain-containing protein [Bacteroidales bacterium]